MRRTLIALFCVSGCSSAPPLPPIGAAVPAAQVSAIKAMPKGQSQVDVIARLLATATPAATLDYDAFAAHERADRSATTAHFAGHVITLKGAIVERSWSAKEDADGILSAQVHSTDKMVSAGLRFAQADAARVLALRPGQRITATCLLLRDMPGFVDDALSTAGCTLSK